MSYIVLLAWAREVAIDYRSRLKTSERKTAQASEMVACTLWEVGIANA